MHIFFVKNTYQSWLVFYCFGVPEAEAEAEYGHEQSSATGCFAAFHSTTDLDFFQPAVYLIHCASLLVCLHHKPLM